MASLTIIVPLYNEAARIDEVLGLVLRQPCVGELLAIDDGSTDDGWDRLLTWRLRDPRVRVFRHARNRGKGAAIRTALPHASCTAVLIQDADMEYDPGCYFSLLGCMTGHGFPVVYGSRYRQAGTVVGEVGWHTLGNRLLTRFANVVTGQALTDEATCYKLFRRDVLAQIDLEQNGFGFCPEVTAKVSRLGIKIHEVAIGYRPRTRAEGKKIRLWHGLEAIWCLVKYRWLDRRWKPAARLAAPTGRRKAIAADAVPTK